MAYASFAASVQHALEDAVVQLVTVAYELAGSSNLVMAGGVAMNCNLTAALRAPGLYRTFMSHQFPSMQASAWARRWP
jgi:carbamoyltransferase